MVNDGKIFECVGPLIDFQLTVYYICTVVWEKFTSNVLNICRIASENMLDTFFTVPHAKKYNFPCPIYAFLC